MTAGRPMKFQSVEEMEKKIDGYFAECDAKEEPYLITGLCLALDISRESLLDYENTESRKQFSDTIKKAKLKCQNYAEKVLMNGRAPVGAIFNLKNNYGWRDKQDIEHSGKMEFGIKKPDGL